MGVRITVAMSDAPKLRVLFSRVAGSVPKVTTKEGSPSQRVLDYKTAKTPALLAGAARANGAREVKCY